MSSPSLPGYLVLMPHSLTPADALTLDPRYYRYAPLYSDA